MKETERAVCEKVAWVYGWLDEQIGRKLGEIEACRGCGKCCDFDRWDHRLYVTSPEMMYLRSKLDGEKMRQLTGGRCGYNEGGKCLIYKDRFAGCRIFMCGGGNDIQSSLSEKAAKMFKSICEEFKMPYEYRDLRIWANGEVC